MENKIGWNTSTRRSRSRSKSPSLLEKQIYNAGEFIFLDSVFYGHYQEKRYVDHLKSYRDLVVINNTETKIINKLIDFIKKCNEKNINNMIWIGVTDPDMAGAPAAGHCIWTKMEDLPFGEYWFKIKKVILRNNEFLLKLNVIKDYKNKENSPSKKIENFNIDTQFFKKLMSNLVSFNLTFENISSCFKNVFLLLFTLLAFSIQALKLFGDYSIKLMEQSINLLKVLAPLASQVLDIFTKFIGAFFVLIAMIWRDLRYPAPGPRYPPLAPPQNMIRGPQRPLYTFR